MQFFYTQLRNILVLCRPKNAISPAIALIIGNTAVIGGSKLSIEIFISVICVILLNFFATLQNDVIDQQIDKASKRNTALTRGEISVNQTMAIAYSFFVIAVAIPMLLGLRQVTIFSIIYAAWIYGYNMLPLQFSRHPISSIVTLSLLLSSLPLMFGYFLASNHLDHTLVFLGIGGFLSRFSISILKDYKDFRADTAYQKITFLVAFGANRVRRISLYFSIFSYIIWIILIIQIRGYKLPVLLGCLLLAILSTYSISQRIILSNSIKKFGVNNNLFHKIIDIQILFEYGVFVCFYLF